MKIKDWKMGQLKQQFNGGFLEEIIGTVRETEKAVQLQIRWSYTSSLSRVENVWIPKSCILSDEEVEREAAAAAERFNAGCAAYDRLIAWAKENGVKGVRSGMKKTTILSKIEAAGLVYAG